jgi:hypothetical protein
MAVDKSVPAGGGVVDKEAERMKKMQASRAVRTKKRSELSAQEKLWLRNAIMAKESASVLENRILDQRDISPESMQAATALTAAVSMLG